MTTEERLTKLERDMEEVKTMLRTKSLLGVKDVEETMVESKNLDAPTFKRRNIIIQK